MTSLSIIPEQIKKARKSKGWGQEELATHSGISQSVISKMERGKSLKLENLLVIADAMEVSLDSLLNRNHDNVVSSNVLNEESEPYKTQKQKYLEDINELKDQTIKRLEREVITYKTHIDRQDKMIEHLQHELELARQR